MSLKGKLSPPVTWTNQRASEAAASSMVRVSLAGTLGAWGWGCGVYEMKQLQSEWERENND